jgi:hypothetical protein
MKVVFVDWKPIERKSDILSGGHIRRYYAWNILNKMFEDVEPFRNKNKNINWKAVKLMFNRESKIWIEYGSGRIAHIIVLLASFIMSKRLIINVHDFVVQQRDYDTELPLLKRIQVKVIENMLLNRASVIILAWPKLLDFFKVKNGQKVIIMIPGVGEDELIVPANKNIDTNRKIALYFGSMRRKDIIPQTIAFFSELKEWELHLIGLEEGEEIVATENIKYLGSVSHDKLSDYMNSADVILVPLPKNEYSDKVMPIKLGYALKSCKPIIMTKTSGISEYISKVGLEENVIYVDEWNLQSLRAALKKAETVEIDAKMTIDRLKLFAWEHRFKRVVEIAFDVSPISMDQIMWN